MKQFIRLTLLCALVGISFFLYQHTAKKPTAPPGTTIRLGISADNPPFTFVKNGEFVGFEIDLAQAIASELKYNLDILDLDFSGLIAAVRNDVIDAAIADFGITEDRKKNVAFSSPYHFSKNNIAIVSKRAYSSPSEFPSARIGLQHGSIFESAAKNLQTLFPKITIIGFHRVNQAVQELEQKTIDIILIDAAVAMQITTSHPELITSTITIPDESDGLGIIFKKESQLIEKFNRAIDTLKTNGTLNLLTKKWLISTETNKE